MIGHPTAHTTLEAETSDTPEEDAAGAEAAPDTCPGRPVSSLRRHFPLVDRLFRCPPGRRLSMIQQGARFLVVGLINTVVDLSVLNVLIMLEPRGRSGWFYSAFKTLSFLAAVTNSYFLNRKFTFQDRKSASSAQFTGFLVVSIGGLLINVGVATAVVTFVPAPDILHAYWPTIAAMAGIPVGLVWNFFGYRYLVF